MDTTQLPNREYMAIRKRSYRVALAINRFDCSMSARYDNVLAQNEENAVVQAIEVAEREFDVSGWQTEYVEVI